uniref:Hypothetical secreted peptide n=1 Tax=Triatoma matogrossensis TaxID=162370 RepID=E2J7C0_9HEMI
MRCLSHSFLYFHLVLTIKNNKQNLVEQTHKHINYKPKVFCCST